MTAQGDILRQLFRGYSKRDDRLFRSAAESLIQDERAKNHRLLADDLERILFNGASPSLDGRLPGLAFEIPKDRERGFPLIDLATFDYDWGRLIVPPKTLVALQQIELEYRRRDVLATAGLRPKERLLFYGPPGCGKTLAAQVLASLLSFPLVTVRFDAVVSSYLGETAANPRRVFDFIQHGQWVVLFDEFDALGKDRDNPFEHGELKRVVNSLLQLMDAFRGESLLIAATNHERLLDRALWRRFDSIVHFPPPTEQDRILLLHLFWRGYDTTRLNFRALARRLRSASGSDVEWLAVECARRAVLAGRNSIWADDIGSAIDSLRERMVMIDKELEEPEPPSAVGLTEGG